METRTNDVISITTIQTCPKNTWWLCVHLWDCTCDDFKGLAHMFRMDESRYLEIKIIARLQV